MTDEWIGAGDVSSKTVVNVPAIGQPVWEGELTDGKIDMVISGLTNPNQGFAKALAIEVKQLRAEADGLRKAVEAAGRIVCGQYKPWTDAGGPNECKHGRAEGIPCYECDRITLGVAVSALGKAGL